MASSSTSVITHQVPIDHDGLVIEGPLPCCGLLATELEAGDMLAVEDNLVTCKAALQRRIRALEAKQAEIERRLSGD